MSKGNRKKNIKEFPMIKLGKNLSKINKYNNGLQYRVHSKYVFLWLHKQKIE